MNREKEPFTNLAKELVPQVLGPIGKIRTDQVGPVPTAETTVTEILSTSGTTPTFSVIPFRPGLSIYCIKPTTHRKLYI